MQVGGRDDEEIGIHVQDDGPTPYQVVQFRASQTYQPVGRRTETLHIYIYIFTVQVMFTATVKNCRSDNEMSNYSSIFSKHNNYCLELHAYKKLNSAEILLGSFNK